MTGLVVGKRDRGPNPPVIAGQFAHVDHVGAGGAEGAIDASNVLKPALSRGEIQCIGATTLDEYRKHIEKDGGSGNGCGRLTQEYLCFFVFWNCFLALGNRFTTSW